MYSKDNASQYDILVVDDDPVVLNLLTHLLEMEHYRVRSASDGNQALQMILQDCPDVLVADWKIPGLDGPELCRRVRQLHSRKVLPHYSYILILTAQYAKHSVVEALEAGADDFIEKDVRSLTEFRSEIQARLNAALRIRKLEIDLEYAAKYDSLTRLLNRTAFFETAHILWERSIRNKVPLAAIMMDCDLFKRVNDIHGHLAGDTVLSELASILRSFSRTTDVISRYGGEEFCAILPGCSEDIAWEWADRIRQRCETIPIKYANTDIFITVSFGVAERTGVTQLFDHLVDQADHALLAAKDRGRNRCVRYSHMATNAAHENEYLAQHLFDNITAKEIMTPFPVSVQLHDSAATVADYFLETKFETLPVTDHEGKLIGIVSETDIITMIGQEECWVLPIRDFVSLNMASYPADTPIRTIINFLNRTTLRRVMIVQDNGMLAGYICHTLLLHWLKNQRSLSMSLVTN